MMEHDRSSPAGKLVNSLHGWPLWTAIGLVGLGVLALSWPRGPKPAAPESSQEAKPPEVRTLRLGLNIAADSALNAAAQRFSDLVASRSGGRLRVTVHPDQQLGNDDQMLEMARNGSLDLVLTPTAKLSSAVPAMQYADLPFYFSGREEVYAMLDGEPGRMLLSKLNSIDLVGLAFWENGFKQFTANTPIRDPRDFTGLRIRTMKSRLLIDQFESLGAKAVPIDFHATYKALADGVIDGEENPLVAIIAMRFHEVQKHMTISNHAYLGYVFSASKRVFEDLSPEMRDVLQRAARELADWERTETARREASFLDTIRSAGVTVHTLSPGELARFRAALVPIADKFAFEVGYDLLTKTEELRYARQPASETKPPYLIGLDADLSGSGAQAGGAFVRGIQLALEEINAKGGLLGRPLRLIARDHGGIARTARLNLEYFASLPTLLAVVGGMHTSVCVEEIEDVHRLRIPYLIPWAAGHDLTSRQRHPNYVFRVSSSDGETTPFLLDRALKQRGPITVVLEQSAWGRSSLATLGPRLEKLPAGKADTVWLYSGEPDVEGKMNAWLGNGARALLVVTGAPLAGAIVRAMARQERPVPVFSQWALTGSDFWRREQAALQRVDLRFVQPILLEETQAHPQLRQFVARYRTRYGLGPDDAVPSPAGSIQAYDLVRILAQAVKRGASSDRTAIRDSLETLPHHSGIMREYAPPFTRGRHDALLGLPLHMGRFDSRGRIVNAD